MRTRRLYKKPFRETLIIGVVMVLVLALVIALSSQSRARFISAARLILVSPSSTTSMDKENSDLTLVQAAACTQEGLGGRDARHPTFDPAVAAGDVFNDFGKVIAGGLTEAPAAEKKFGDNISTADRDALHIKFGNIIDGPIEMTNVWSVSDAFQSDSPTSVKEYEVVGIKTTPGQAIKTPSSGRMILNGTDLSGMVMHVTADGIRFANSRNDKPTGTEGYNLYIWGITPDPVIAARYQCATTTYARQLFPEMHIGQTLGTAKGNFIYLAIRDNGAFQNIRDVSWWDGKVTAGQGPGGGSTQPPNPGTSTPKSCGNTPADSYSCTDKKNVYKCDGTTGQLVKTDFCDGLTTCSITQAGKAYTCSQSPAPNCNAAEQCSFGGTCDNCKGLYCGGSSCTQTGQQQSQTITRTYTFKGKISNISAYQGKTLQPFIQIAAADLKVAAITDSKVVSTRSSVNMSSGDLSGEIVEEYVSTDKAKTENYFAATAQNFVVSIDNTIKEVRQTGVVVDFGTFALTSPTTGAKDCVETFPNGSTKTTTNGAMYCSGAIPKKCINGTVTAQQVTQDTTLQSTTTMACTHGCEVGASNQAQCKRAPTSPEQQPPSTGTIEIKYVVRGQGTWPSLALGGFASCSGTQYFIYPITTGSYATMNQKVKRQVQKTVDTGAKVVEYEFYVDVPDFLSSTNPQAASCVSPPSVQTLIPFGGNLTEFLKIYSRP